MPPVGYRDYLLRSLPGTPKELIERTGLNPRTVTGLLKKLRASAELHIGKWSRSQGRGNFQPTYVAGPGKDAVCKLKPLTDSQIGKRCWARMKGTPAHDRRKAKDTARYFAKKAAKRGDPMINALHGRNPQQQKESP